MKMGWRSAACGGVMRRADASEPGHAAGRREDFMPGEPVPPAAAAAAESVNSGIAPFDAGRRLVETVDREIVTALTILPGLPGELAAVAERGWPETAATLPGTLGVCLAVALVFVAVSMPCLLVWAGIGAGAGRVLGTPSRLRAFNIAMALLLVASLVPMLR